MSDKDIYIHIGLPRAGSTFVQEFMYSNLFEEEICFNPQEISKKILPDFMRKLYIQEEYSEQDILKFKEDIYSVLNKIKAPKIFLSNEGLSGMDFQIGKKNADKYAYMLRRIFPHAKIIIILRNQVEWISSAFYLAIRYGYVVSFNRFINYKNGGFHPRKTNDYWSIDVFDLDFNEIYNTFRNNFDTIYVLNFSVLKKNPECFFEKIQDILGVTYKSKEVYYSSQNKGYPKKFLKTMGYVGQLLLYKCFWKEQYFFLTGIRNLSFIDKTKSIFLKIYYRFIKKVSHIMSIFIKNDHLLSDSQKQVIEDYYKEKNNKFWKELKS